MLMVIGSRLGAMLPDVWDWEWYRQAKRGGDPCGIDDRLRSRAGQLDDRQALALLGLSAGATHEQVRAAWRRAAQRWHPDRAPDEAARSEYHVRFITCQAAYERLCHRG